MFVGFVFAKFGECLLPSDENFPEKFKSENFPENFPFFYKDFLYCYNYVDIYLTFHSDWQMN
jgi:hypothetical protein